MQCRKCIHYRYCLERRGICTDYKTREEVQADIERINQAYRSEAARNQSGVQEAPETSDGDGAIYQGSGDGVQAVTNIRNPARGPRTPQADSRGAKAGNGGKESQGTGGGREAEAEAPTEQGMDTRKDSEV